jgi:hypothetical protein
MFAQLAALNVYFEVRVSFLFALGFLSSSIRPQDEDDDTEVDDDDVEEDDPGWSLPAAVAAAAADTSTAATLETGSTRSCTCGCCPRCGPGGGRSITIHCALIRDSETFQCDRQGRFLQNLPHIHKPIGDSRDHLLMRDNQGSLAYTHCSCAGQCCGYSVQGRVPCGWLWMEWLALDGAQ